MRRRNTLLVLVAVCLVALAVALLLARQTEPTYEGKTLAQWTKKLPPQWEMPGTPISDQQAVAAICALCTNRLPALVQDIAYDDRPRAARVLTTPQWVPMSIRYWRFIFLPPAKAVRVDTAMAALRALGSNAAPAIPALTNLVRGTNPIIAFRAAMILPYLGPDALALLVQLAQEPGFPARQQAARISGLTGVATAIGYMRYMGTNAEAAVPALIELSRNNNKDVAEAAARALGDLAMGAETAVPALANLLTNSNSQTRYAAANALQQFGSNAVSAVPALLPVLQDKELFVRDGATNALRAIIPKP